MKAIIRIQMDNAAFVDPGPELARILVEVAGVVGFDAQPGLKINLRDVNGNTVGSLEVKKG